jgi:hypothetical protein
VTMLPPSSYHVTVFGGLNEDDRGKPRWPVGVAKDLSVDAATQAWREQLASRAPLQPPGFDFVVAGAPALMLDGAPHIPLEPADATHARRLTALRDELSKLTGIRRADHDRYVYHVTFAYIHTFLNPDEARQLQAATAQCMALLPRRLHVPAIHLCRFKDMYAFETLHPL